MPVTFVSSYGGLGGSEIYLERLLSALGRAWVHEVILLGHGPFVDRLRRAGFSTRVIATSGRPHSLLAGAMRLRRHLGRGDHHLIHANGLKATLLCALAIRRNVPLIWVKHDFAMDGWRARLLAARCERIIGVSAASIQTFGSRVAHKTDVVHTGLAPVPRDRFAARNKVLELFGDPAPAAVIALVGQLIRGKGHLEVLEIAPALHRREGRTGLLFIGGTPPSGSEEYVEQLEERVARLGLDPRETLVGHRDDVLELLAGCDVVVIPSLPHKPSLEVEAFPLVALEAMAVGTPVVGYAVGGLPELVADCGTLVPVGDRQALRDAIVALLDDAAIWQARHECGLQRVVDDFSMTTMVDQMKSNYLAVARGA